MAADRSGRTVHLSNAIARGHNTHEGPGLSKRGPSACVVAAHATSCLAPTSPRAYDGARLGLKTALVARRVERRMPRFREQLPVSGKTLSVGPPGARISAVNHKQSRSGTGLWARPT